MFKYLSDKLVDGLSKMEAHRNLKNIDALNSEFRFKEMHSKTRNSKYVNCNSPSFKVHC